MPLYEYKCRDCHDTFETLIRHKDDELDLKCPHCDSQLVERLLSAHGGYNIMGDNSASRRPSQAGSFRKGVRK